MKFIIDYNEKNQTAKLSCEELPSDIGGLFIIKKMESAQDLNDAFLQISNFLFDTVHQNNLQGGV